MPYKYRVPNRDIGLDFSLGKIATNVRVSENGRDTAEADLWLENGDTMRMDIPEGFVPREW